MNPYSKLDTIKSPEDLKNLNLDELTLIAHELRKFLIETILENGGHFAANLGTVELTVALHHIFDLPADKLIWDVGHQAYGHKVLTGRKNELKNIRKMGGISGFPNVNESAYDSFGTGHSSTSISAALGFAEANFISKKKDFAIAITGDGALTGGQSFEALNNLPTHRKLNLLIIINDNNIGIDSNEGLIGKFLKIKHKSKVLFKNIQYHSSINGHNLDELTQHFSTIKAKGGIHFLPIKTIKGKGYPKAEKSQTQWHSTSKKFVKLRQAEKKKLHTFQDVFADTMVEIADFNDKAIAITPAMPTGSSLGKMIKKYPNRVFDVGIAEQHAITFSAAMSLGGFKPFSIIYSTFLQRGFDQIIHDVALQNLSVVFCIDRAGLVGNDGATHHGIFDLAYLNLIPNMAICAPMTGSDFRKMLHISNKYTVGPIAIRYPKNYIPEVKNTDSDIEFGKGKELTKGKNLCIISIGYIGNIAQKVVHKLATKNIVIGHLDLRYLKPLDTELIKKIFNNYSTIITLEDGIINGGMGSVISSFSTNNNFKNNIHHLGINDTFPTQGSINELYEIHGLDEQSILEFVKRMTI